MLLCSIVIKHNVAAVNNKLCIQNKRRAMNHRCAALFMSAVDVSPSINSRGEVGEGEERGEVSPKTTWPLQAVHQSSEIETLHKHR